MRRLPWLAALLYAFGLLSGAFAIWSAIRALIAIAEAMQTGMPFFGYGYVFTEHLMVTSNAGVWFVYALVLLGVGRILHVQLGGEDDGYEGQPEYDGDETTGEPEAEDSPTE